MTDICKIGLRLNAVTGPKVNAPAINPDTLRELVNPYYGFLQTYSLIGDSVSWHGQLKNIGLQYRIPCSIRLPRVRISERVLGWRESDIETWLNEKTETVEKKS